MEFLNVNRLSKSYDGETVLGPLSFSVSKGEVVSLIGGNGAGKTTLLEVIAGIRQATSGTVTVEGKGSPAVAFLPQKMELYPELTVRETVRHFATLYGRDSSDRMMNLLSVRELADKRYSSLSGGQKQRVNVCCILCQEPDIVLMDEPATGMDPKVRGETWQIIHTLKSQSVTVILSTHFIEDARKHSDRILLLRRGQLVYDGAPDGLRTGRIEIRIPFTVSDDRLACLNPRVVDGRTIFTVGDTSEMLLVLERLRETGLDVSQVSVDTFEDLEACRWVR